MTTAVYNGEELNLSKLTIDGQMKFVEIDAEQNMIAKAEMMYEALSEMIGDRFAEIVDGDDYKTCDLTIMSDLYYVVTDAYGNDMHKTQFKKQADDMKTIDALSNKAALFNKAIQNAQR